MNNEMKDSGIEWIGKIPVNCNITRISRLYRITLGKMLQPKQNDDDDVYCNYLCAANIKWNGVDTSNVKQMWFSKEELQKYELHEGDCLIMEGGSAGTSTLYHSEFFPCYFQNSINRAAGINGNLNQYLVYWLSFVFHSGYIDAICNRATLKHYTKEKVEATPIVVRTQDEQKRIVSFLDKKINQIDSLISNQEKQIEKLEEYKQALITKAVTKGLDPNAAMRDSGVEWIGEIPGRWKTIKIKFTSWLKGRIGWDGLKSTEFVDYGPYLITGTDFKNGEIDWNTCVHISEERFAEDELLHIKENDLLITKDGTIGKLAIVKNCPEKVSLNSGVMIIRNSTSFKYFDKYLYYVLKSNQFLLWYELSQAGNSTIRHLYQGQFYNFEFTYPSIDEQREISEQLDKECLRMDALIDLKKRKISKLESYKKSIIYEYVTGKKRVEL